MNERPLQQNSPVFELRPEYNVDAARHYAALAIEGIEDLIAWVGLEPGAVGYSADAERVRRHFIAYSSDDGMREDDEILYSDLSRVRLLRASSIIETEATLEEYHKGILQRMAKLTLREFIGDSPYPLINDYCIEQFVGGGTHATVSVTDLIKGQGLEERPMTQYDFEKLVQAAINHSHLLLGSESAQRS